MPDFTFKGRNSQGKFVTDNITADDESAAAKLLMAKGITPLDITKAIKKNVDSTTKNFLSIEIGGRVKLSDIVMFSRQMKSLTKAGLPIATSMEKLAESTKSKILRRALYNIGKDVSSGMNLSLSIAQYPKVFSPIFVNMIETGEHTGKLEEAFDHLTKYLELEISVRKRIKAIMRYPIIVISAIVIAMTIINIMVIPAFAKMFSKFHSELPLPTKILLESSAFFVNYWPFLLSGVIICIIAIRIYINQKNGRYLWDYLKVHLPIFGPTIMQILLMRFSSLFAMIFRSGVPLIKGMALVANAVGNTYLKAIIFDLRDRIESGSSLLNAAHACKLFPPLVLQMISVGEESGTLDSMLEQVADFYEREVDYNIQRLGDLMEPILLVIIACMVLVMALGVFLPMWEMATFPK